MFLFFFLIFFSFSHHVSIGTSTVTVVVVLVSASSFPFVVPFAAAAAAGAVQAIATAAAGAAAPAPAVPAAAPSAAFLDDLKGIDASSTGTRLGCLGTALFESSVRSSVFVFFSDEEEDEIDVFFATSRSIFFWLDARRRR